MTENTFLASVVAAATVTGIAITFWNNRVSQQVSKRKLRLDLFDKRYAIWSRFHDQSEELYTKTIGASPDDFSLQQNFHPLAKACRASIKEMVFLFPHDTIVICELLIESQWDYVIAMENWLSANLDNWENIKEISERKSELYDLVEAYRDTLTDNLAQVLGFSEVTKEGEASPLGKALINSIASFRANASPH